jgi:hypothetical protein
MVQRGEACVFVDYGISRACNDFVNSKAAGNSFDKAGFSASKTAPQSDYRTGRKRTGYLPPKAEGFFRRNGNTLNQEALRLYPDYRCTALIHGIPELWDNQ